MYCLPAQHHLDGVPTRLTLRLPSFEGIIMNLMIHWQLVPPSLTAFNGEATHAGGAGIRDDNVGRSSESHQVHRDAVTGLTKEPNPK